MAAHEWQDTHMNTCVCDGLQLVGAAEGSNEHLLQLWKSEERKNE
jgi:hypothetical protein